MEPDLVVFAIALFLMLLYGISQAWTWQRTGGYARLAARITALSSRQLAYSGPVRPNTQARPAVIAKARRPRVRRTAAQLAAEERIILASLAAQVEPGLIAAALAGDLQYNRRRVIGVLRAEAARTARAAQLRAAILPAPQRDLSTL